MINVVLRMLVKILHFHFRDGRNDTDEKLRDILILTEEYLAKVDGGECKHHHYETRTHPELGDQPFCPACDEFIEL